VFDTNLVVVGNVLVAPQWRRIQSSGSLVAHFRVASTSRRFDRENNCWVDGNNLRVRVTAWRRLAEGVASSILVGDPVIVYGRLYTRDWTDDKGNNRTSYEMEAFSIGHDLSRGRGRFFRGARADQSTTSVEDDAAEAYVAGELSMPLTGEEVPVGYGEGVPEAESPEFAEVVAGLEDPDDEIEMTVEPVSATRRNRRTAKREPVPA
jgi:single-strand DNA-binding protein